ncbi:MAG: metallophosphatase family protein [Candidatus Thermoplasmatota archaeon]|nr:metallophosphatase family protein [Candidatus Thermoplasmatota archaeon]
MTRVLIASDIHANVEAAKEMFKVVSYDFGIYLGDIVDYGPKPSEAIQLVRDKFDEVIQGNHDYAASHGSDDMCSPENKEVSAFTRENITRKLLSKEELQYLGSLKRSLISDIDGMRLACFHGKPNDPLFGYLYPWEISQEKFKNAEGRLPVYDYIVVGHTHYQFLTQYDGMAVMNPGSAGQPRDFSHNPSYILLDTKSQNVEMKRFKFDRFNLARELKDLIPDRRLLEKDFKLFHLL